MKSFIATAILLAGALQASAQTLTVISTTSGGNGCPQATPPTISVTSSAISYTGPSTWAASTGPGVPIRAGLTARLMFKSASRPTGGSGLRAPLSPSLRAPPAVTLPLLRRPTSSPPASVSGTGTSTITSTGPTTVTTPYSPATVWSPCGGTDAVNINTAIRAVGSAAGSIQVTGAVNTPIIWETC
ncbi:hypothetical protein DFP72DRAFT_1144061 [Ephemerocybe angulata]|uniref:Antifreeze protein n=1 Tax=Ephemerocybe angulata TaxID=980116 RepID=A0A8H6HM50_9AGAR|nr:hypothetical protein DFP72DRAFT_1144061 [Tulosesus angulatus]